MVSTNQPYLWNKRHLSSCIGGNVCGICLHVGNGLIFCCRVPIGDWCSTPLVSKVCSLAWVHMCLAKFDIVPTDDIEWPRLSWFTVVFSIPFVVMARQDGWVEGFWDGACNCSWVLAFRAIRWQRFCRHWSFYWGVICHLVSPAGSSPVTCELQIVHCWLKSPYSMLLNTLEMHVVVVCLWVFSTLIW